MIKGPVTRPEKDPVKVQDSLGLEKRGFRDTLSHPQVTEGGLSHILPGPGAEPGRRECQEAG